MEKLLSMLLLLFPHKSTTINSNLSKSEILTRLEHKFIPELTIGVRTFWSNDSRYVGHLIGDHMDIDGPYGYKKWTLNTQVNILDYGQVSKVKINSRLSIANILSIILVFGFYFTYAIFVIQLSFWQILIFQILFIYGVCLIVFHAEAEYVVKLIKESLQE